MSDTAPIAAHGTSGAAAPELPDILPPVKDRRGLARFIYRHPTMAIGGGMLLILIAIALLAPWLGTGDPNAIAPAKRNREPSAEHWFGTDAFGKDIYVWALRFDNGAVQVHGAVHADHIAGLGPQRTRESQHHLVERHGA